MGLLAESKSRRKLHHDPNNTKWTRDETTFGQKIMRAQGWQPGQFLGAKDAAQKDSYSAANASYIRVALKDDTKGLGASKRPEDQIPGLDDFTDLLARLNGKSQAAIDETKQARMYVKMNAYVQNKFGPMRFVRGGLLVGDEVKENKEEEDKSDDTSNDTAKSATETENKDKKSKKRKASALDEDDDSSSSSSSDESSKKSKKRRKEDKKSKKSKSKKSKSADNDDSDSDPAERSSKRKSKSKSKKDKEQDSDDSDSDAKAKKSKKERKEEKRAKKERKREKKEAKKRKKLEAGSSSSSKSATPATSGTSTPRRNPYAVRSRFLAAKREALMDEKALNKIWMVKT